MAVLLLICDGYATVPRKLQAFKFVISVQHLDLTLVYCSTHTSELHMTADGEKL
jgi:hypothetical protein